MESNLPPISSKPPNMDNQGKMPFGQGKDSSTPSKSKGNKIPANLA